MNSKAPVHLARRRPFLLPRIALPIPRLLLLVNNVARRMMTPDTAAHAAYEAAKAIDRHSGDGTNHISGYRAHSFYLLNRADFYEPLSTLNEVERASQYNELLEEGGAPQWAGCHIQLGFRVFRSMYTAPGGVLQLPVDGEDEVGDHSVAMLGWDHERDYLVFGNSWSDKWGDRGIGYMPPAYFESFATDVWCVRTLKVGPHPAKLIHFREAADVPVARSPDPR